MGIREFRMGRRHGREGKPYLVHRSSRRYDGAHANDSYLDGYKYGIKEREDLRVNHTDATRSGTRAVSGCIPHQTRRGNIL